jgi:hypothetical protein
MAVLRIAGQGQARTRLDAKVSQPREFADRWVRLVSDTLWSDTVELIADGRVRRWNGPTVPDSTRWAVVQSRVGDALCIGPRTHPNCQPFRLEGDTLVLGPVPKQSYEVFISLTPNWMRGSQRNRRSDSVAAYSALLTGASWRMRH